MIRVLSTAIPVYVVEPNDKQEDIKDKMCYLIAKSGIYLKQEQPLFDSVSKVTEMHLLGDIKEKTTAFMPKIPLALIVMVHKFFSAIYEKFKSEVVVILHWNPDTNKWTVDVPEQTVGAASITYDRKATRKIEGCIRVGSIHSHASMGAFHSGTDTDDEVSFDGIHITIGNLNLDAPTFASRIMINGKETKFELMNRINLDPFEVDTVPQEWMDKVKEHVYANTGTYLGRSYDGYGYDDDYYPGTYGYPPYAAQPPIVGAKVHEQSQLTDEDVKDLERVGVIVHGSGQLALQFHGRGQKGGKANFKKRKAFFDRFKQTGKIY